MKKLYLDADIEIIDLTSADIISTSINQEEGGYGETNADEGIWG